MFGAINIELSTFNELYDQFPVEAQRTQSNAS